MKAVIAIVIVAVLAFGGYKVWEYWTQTDKDKTAATAPPAQVNAQSLQGLPQQLETPLAEAQKKGPDAFKEYIDSIKKSPLVKDPRLAWIELDYVVMVASKDPAEAKRVFTKVKERTPADSPVYPRIKSLEKTFE
jgi:hypothetical protein